MTRSIVINLKLQPPASGPPKAINRLKTMIKYILNYKIMILICDKEKNLLDSMFGTTGLIMLVDLLLVLKEQSLIIWAEPNPTLQNRLLK